MAETLLPALAKGLATDNWDNLYAGLETEISKIFANSLLDENGNVISERTKIFVPDRDLKLKANTIKILPDSQLYGYNTDVYGFVEAIPEEIRAQIENSEIAVLGNGGAARAVGVGISILKAKKIDFYVRNIINAAEMVEALRENFPNVQMNCKQIEGIKDLSQYKMLVNTTPIGMRSKAMGLSPIDEDVVKTMNKDSVVYDIVYNPLNTELIKYAKKHGIKTIQGLDMLIYQGAKAFEIWTGKKPDVLKMKIAALEAMVD